MPIPKVSISTSSFTALPLGRKNVIDHGASRAINIEHTISTKDFAKIETIRPIIDVGIRRKANSHIMPEGVVVAVDFRLSKDRSHLLRCQVLLPYKTSLLFCYESGFDITAYGENREGTWVLSAWYFLLLSEVLKGVKSGSRTDFLKSLPYKGFTQIEWDVSAEHIELDESGELETRRRRYTRSDTSIDASQV